MFSRVEEIEVGRQSIIIRRIKDYTTFCVILGSSKQPHETSLQYVKRVLKVDINWSVWDFDSTVLAEQLTMIDKELFLKIPSEELSILVWQQNAKNTPNISAMLAFSHRTSSLIASEVLKDESEKVVILLFNYVSNNLSHFNSASNFY